MHKISKAYLIERIFDSLLFLSKKEIYKERKFPFFLYCFGHSAKDKIRDGTSRRRVCLYSEFRRNFTRLQETRKCPIFVQPSATEKSSISSPLTNLRFVEKMATFSKYKKLGSFSHKAPCFRLYGSREKHMGAVRRLYGSRESP